jgi:hypothetical protein
MSVCCRLRSSLIDRVSSGGKAYLYRSSVWSLLGDTTEMAAYHDQNAMKKPHQEKKNTLPY